MGEGVFFQLVRISVDAMWFQIIKTIWQNLISNCFIWTPPAFTPVLYIMSYQWKTLTKAHKQIKDTITEEDECLDYDNFVALSGLSLFHRKSCLCFATIK